jgi:hypothetical protein
VQESKSSFLSVRFLIVVIMRLSLYILSKIILIVLRNGMLVKREVTSNDTNL